ncbi:MAG: metallophosphoesterase [Marinilabiliales bacterium]|nr:metallophosphoesterase [Marinilabiliales bacterium]
MKSKITFLLAWSLFVVSLQAQMPFKSVKLPDKALNFVVASDMGRRGISEQRAIAGWMGETAAFHKLGFVVVAGDPIHDEGVKSTTDPEWQEKFESIYTAPSLMHLPWYVVSGNHEYRGSVQAILDYSQISDRWKAPARYFTIEKEMDSKGTRCLLVLIDTTPLIEKYRTDGHYSDAGLQDAKRQLAWIDSILVVSNCKWKIVIGHHPVYADTGKDLSERTDMQRQLEGILDKRKADLYICGHIHNFQHIRPKGKSVDYVVNSSASLSRPVQPIDGTLFCSGDPGFTVCSVTSSALTFYFVNHKGEAIYSREKKK